MSKENRILEDTGKQFPGERGEKNTLLQTFGREGLLEGVKNVLGETEEKKKNKQKKEIPLEGNVSPE